MPARRLSSDQTLSGKRDRVMALDVYQSCLGGMPRKIKFCPCAKDMLGDLNKIVDALQGGQRAGAMSLLNRQLELKGSRACLLTLKGLTQLQMDDMEGVAKTADEFLQAHPDNPVACSLSAIVGRRAAEPRRRPGTAAASLGRRIAGDPRNRVRGHRRRRSVC